MRRKLINRVLLHVLQKRVEIWDTWYGLSNGKQLTGSSWWVCTRRSSGLVCLFWIESGFIYSVAGSNHHRVHWKGETRTSGLFLTSRYPAVSLWAPLAGRCELMTKGIEQNNSPTYVAHSKDRCAYKIGGFCIGSSYCSFQFWCGRGIKYVGGKSRAAGALATLGDNIHNLWCVAN